MQHLGEYIELLEEDPSLLNALERDPAPTVNDARLSKDEKEALWHGDIDRIETMIGRPIPAMVRDVISKLPAHRPVH